VKKIIISQDFEMMWGVHHLYQEKINKYMKLYLNIPKIVENTLRLLKERNSKILMANQFIFRIKKKEMHDIGLEVSFLD
jgi:hypothetical protein